MAESLPKVLVVDDDELLLEVIAESLRSQFAVDLASSGAAALQKIAADGPYAVVVSDRSMPKMNGVELLEQVRNLAPDTVRIMLTGDKEQQAAVEAINRGQVYYFLTKPCLPEQLVEAVEAGVNRHRLARVKRELSNPAIAAGVSVLVDVLGTVAPSALTRGQRLRDSMRRFAAHLQIADTQPYELATLLSQIGCATVPPTVYRRYSFGVELWPQEIAILRQVPQFGHDLLADLPDFPEIARIVLYQQKNFDGSGFPGDGVAGTNIPLGARMLKILLDRSEYEGQGIVKARLKAVMGEKTSKYDPQLLEACFAALPEFLVNPLSKDHPVVHRRISGLRPGQVLVSDVRSRSGDCVLEAGSRLTQATIRHLEQLAVLNTIEEPLLVQEPIASGQ
ncbi:MAG TPA: HD domain-containing phosphohydrolase [Opitutaceae bacterium]|jgi:response regulator RpfG family c-di-GMP phosphodiesterase|nr:HD domain-containing phosphohydrolase [Opitutaceae bacterium]